jgi:HEAT repeats
MECRELTGRVVDRLQGEADETGLLILADHLEGCPRCAIEAERIESGWALLGRDADAPVTEDFRRRSLELIDEEMLRQRIRSFRPRPRGRAVLRYAAAVLLAAAVGYFARGVLSSPASGPASAVPALAGKSDLPDFDSSPRLANVSYTPPDAQGRIGIAFDTTSRQTIVGRPEDPAVARVLSYLVAGNAETAGGKTRAIELLSTHYGATRAQASPEIVAALTSTLRTDSNPGVRKKAADALAGFRMTPEVRAAFLDALRSDRNPAVRLAAVEALAAAARETPPDEATIESLREKAFDPSENGFVRARAASALKAIDL